MSNWLKKISRQINNAWKARHLRSLYQSQQTKQYWYRQQKWHEARLWFTNQLFRIQLWRQAQIENTSNFRSLIRAIFPQILFAIFVVIALEIIEYWLRQLKMAMGWQIPVVRSIRLDFDAYGALLGVIIQVSGAFLALYFTAVTVVASTVYSEVSDDVRQLLIKEKVGNLYFKVVALLGVLSVFIAGLLIFGYHPGKFNLVLILFLAAFSIFSFIILGLNTMNFFNPIPLLWYLDRDFLRWASSASPSGLMWYYEPFQRHYQKQAEKTLKTYHNIILLVTARKGMGAQPIITSIAHALSLLQQYATIKLYIPTESYWFSRKGEFENWLMVDHTKLSLAIATHTDIQQKAIPNLLWVEEILHSVIDKAIRELLEKRDWQSILEAMNQWQIAQYDIGHQWGIDETKMLQSEMGSLMKSAIIITDQAWISGEIDTHELGSRIAVMDFYQLGRMQVSLSIIHRLKQLSVESFGAQIAGINWIRRQDIYQIGLPRKIVIQLEHLYNHLELEVAAENHLITPIWYLQQFAATAFASYILSFIEESLSMIEQNFVAEAQWLNEQKSLVFTAQTCLRGMEGVSKVKLSIAQSQQFLEQLATLRRDFDFHLVNTHWPEIEWQKLRDRLDAAYKQLLILLGKTVPVLISLPESEYIPDLFGQTYSVLAQECFDAMASASEDLFQEIFKPYFFASICAYQRVSQQAQIHNPRYYNAVTIDPIINVMEISGYACVYSELNQGNFWNVVKQQWDLYFSDSKTKDTRLAMIKAFAEHKDSVFGATSRELTRTSWRQEFGAQMRKRGISDDFNSDFHRMQSKLRGYSPIIQAIMSRSIGSIPWHELYVVFLAIYFDENSPSPYFTQPRRVQEFLRSLEMAKNRTNEEEG